ncbi:hypothetical protein [Nocardia sp. NPDC004722]
MSVQGDFERVAGEMADRGVTIAKVFGKPAYKDADGKAFACLFQDALACRLLAGTPEHAEALALPGAELFDPSSRHRPMKDWVSVPHANADRWLDFAEIAYTRPR